MDIEKKEDIFEKYNRAGNVPLEGFKNSQVQTHPKAKAIVKIIQQVEKDIINIINYFNTYTLLTSFYIFDRIIKS